MKVKKLCKLVYEAPDIDVADIKLESYLCQASVPVIPTEESGHEGFGDEEEEW